ncbi:HR-like lesion-inducing protein-related [Forsythia ovata]|uniref:HR-like lesion-inducing protein-related n=1 Tax=Forsythia ovata TaxID=205694 RepID=A0ABD1T5H7_9LAMI
MGFFSFLGRLLFASLFILSAWQMFNDFGEDGGPAAKEWATKLVVVKKFLTSNFGKASVNIDTRHFVAACIVLKGLGGLLFVFGSSSGAFLLMYYLIFTTPLLYDFYNFNVGEPEFVRLLSEFLQSVALFGALLFFLGMKNSIGRKQLKKKTPKQKTA